MPRDEEQVSSSSSNLYVYPVKSLFTGIHAQTSSTSVPDNQVQHINRQGADDTFEPSEVHKGKLPVNFRYFPGEDDNRHSFATNPLQNRDNVSTDPPPSKIIEGPTGEILSYTLDNLESPLSLHPQPISSAGASAMTDGYAGSDAGSSRSSIVNAGLVHLAPVRSEDISARSRYPNSVDGSQSSRAGGGSIPSSSIYGGSDPPSSKSEEGDGNEPLITYRFQHLQLGDGDQHVIIGREGKLTRCEDEPIRVPGAVQGFGVLIAVEEEGGMLVNASELLGISSQYLFSLDCFTRTLPDSQADILWDNVQFLIDRDTDAADAPEGPQVFLLSGWGEPGSAEEGTNQSTGSRVWTCWCAAHRSPSGPIILEFELERDIYNPLYPLPPTDSTSSGTSSRGSKETSDLGSSTASADSTMNLLSTPVQEETQQGLRGEENWFPRPEDILESTTSHSKPLRALERMRKMNKPESGGGRVNRGRSGVRGAGIGTMDVFSVLAQVNDQLAGASDLDMFMKIVVGVIKDLCQFHRVLIYQFDEMWNGLVTAELVDWNHTHDLYKNLHFPASDIPAQARELYLLNKVRLLYDRSQPTARLVVRTRKDLEHPLVSISYPPVLYIDMDLGYDSFLYTGDESNPSQISGEHGRKSLHVYCMLRQIDALTSIIAFGSLWGLIACHSYGEYGMRVSFPVRQMMRLLSDAISRNVERLCYAQRLHTRKLSIVSIGKQISTLPNDSHPTGYIISNAEDLLSLFDADYGVLVVGEGAKILGPNQHGQEILILAEYLRLKQFEMLQVSQAVTVDFPDLVLPTGLEVIAGLLYVPLSSGGKDFIALLRKGQMRDVYWAGRPYKATISVIFHQDGAAAKAILEPRKSFKMWSEKVVGRCRAWTDEQLETAGVLALVYGKFIEVWRQKESALQSTPLTNLLLSNASHEVRTPLNHIINYLELALNGALDNETRENLTRSHTASKSLLFTINDLLDLTRLESGGETSFNEPFDLHACVDEAVHLYKIEAGRRGLTFQVTSADSPRFVIGDAKKIRTVLGNLVANALKYTPDGKITVECRRFPEPPGLRTPQQVAVEFIVADTGCGMSEAKLESMFREFEQVELTSSKSGNSPGLGLGLAVVARIIEQLGGQLRVDSKSNEGSTFSFLIPFGIHSHSSDWDSSTRSQESKSPSNSTTSPNKDILLSQLKGPADLFEKELVRPRKQSREKLKVLVVDDDTINRTILAKRLTLDGHEVVGSTNGKEGVEVVEADRTIDCILMDIQMPILDGFEATKYIRALERYKPYDVRPTRRSLALNGRIPIFAVSASLIERQRHEMLELGFDGWLLKPLDFKRLKVILRGITDASERMACLYHSGCNWEAGGWLSGPELPSRYHQ
ncbi:hypothetical protein Clacol_009917 [Clathrus columnatus]|uniref:Phytochrome n=1 Tax=Clathrus columnatus TaxID=1419009 RepID=A0AAV5ASA8_9AGAM|nr:hypothetical protein Clacol_009917 [Clathrus columnatus]